MLGILLAEADAERVETVVEERLVQAALADLLLERLQLLLYFLELLLASHVVDDLVILIVARLNLRLDLLALVVEVLHVLNQLPELTRQLFLLLRDLSQLRDCLLILLINSYLVFSDK